MEQPKKILLILGAIGDTLMFTPTIRVLHQAWPKAQIDAVVMFAGSKAVLEKNLAVKNIVHINLLGQSKLKSLREIGKIRQIGYDISILGYPAFRREYHILSWLLGAKKRLAHDFRTGHFSELAFLDNGLQQVDMAAHNIENNLNLLYFLDINWSDYLLMEEVKYDFELKPEWIKEADDYLEKLEILSTKSETNSKHEIRNHKSIIRIGLHPGSTVSPAALMRRWSPKYFAEVADKIVEKEKAQIFIFAGPEERDVAYLIKDLMKYQPVIVDNLKIGPVMALVKKMDLMICNESGLSHIATSVNTPLIMIVGSTNPRLSSPRGAGKIAVLRKAQFPPWHWYENKRSVPKGCENSSGMEAVTPHDVLITAKEMKVFS